MPDAHEAPSASPAPATSDGRRPRGRSSEASPGELWDILEEGASWIERLEALDALADLVDLAAPPHRPRLERLRGDPSRSLAHAVERALLDAEKAASAWSSVSRAPGSRLPSDAPGRRRLDLVTRETLRSSDPEARLRFVRIAACQKRFEISVPLGTQLMVEQDPRVAAEMARTLGKLGSSSAVRALSFTGRRPEARVRRGVVFGLAWQRSFEATRLLVRYLGDHAVAVRDAAYRSVLTLPRAEVLRALEEARERGDARVLLASRDYLETIPSCPAREALIEKLVTLERGPACAMGMELLEDLSPFAHAAVDESVSLR